MNCNNVIITFGLVYTSSHLFYSCSVNGGIFCTDPSASLVFTEQHSVKVDSGQFFYPLKSTCAFYGTFQGTGDFWETRGYECWAYDGPCSSLRSSTSRSGTYAELLFVDCCSAFDAVLSSGLNDKLLHLEAEQSFSQGGGRSAKLQS